MARRNYLEKQCVNYHKNYEAPTCGELKKMLRERDLFQWSKEDELIVLDKLVQFSGQNNNNNNNNNINNNADCYYYSTSQFYKYVNKMLSVQVSENQLCYMIYCLRKRYLEQCEEQGEKEKEKEDLNGCDEYGVKVLELSRKIWGGGSVVDGRNGLVTKVVRDNNEKDLEVYVVEELGFGVDCLTASVLEEIKKDWEEFRFVEEEFRMMQRRFTLQLCQLKTNIHNTQLQPGHTFTSEKLQHFHF